MPTLPLILNIELFAIGKSLLGLVMLLPRLLSCVIFFASPTPSSSHQLQ